MLSLWPFPSPASSTLPPPTLTNSPTKYVCDIPPPRSITQGLLWSHPQIQKTSLDPLGPSQHSSPARESGACPPDPSPHTHHSSWAQPERQLLQCLLLKAPSTFSIQASVQFTSQLGNTISLGGKVPFTREQLSPERTRGRPRGLEISANLISTLTTDLRGEQPLLLIALNKSAR